MKDAELMKQYLSSSFNFECKANEAFTRARYHSYKGVGNPFLRLKYPKIIDQILKMMFTDFLDNTKFFVRSGQTNKRRKRTD